VEPSRVPLTEYGDDTASSAKLERGEIQPIPRDCELNPVDVHTIYPAGPRPSPKIRAFSE
jgi:hypothetical protein